MNELDRHIAALKRKIKNSTNELDIETWSELLKAAESELKMRLYFQKR